MTDEEAPVHASGNCTGQWSVVSSSLGALIQCSKCESTFPASKKRIDSALYENWMGALLDIVANQGVFYLSGENEVTGN